MVREYTPSRGELSKKVLSNLNRKITKIKLSKDTQKKGEGRWYRICHIYLLVSNYCVSQTFQISFPLFRWELDLYIYITNFLNRK